MKCIVKDCANHMHEGRFVGELCTPCHTFITTGEGTYSQAYRNSQRTWVGLTEEEILAFVFDAKITEPNDEPIKFGAPSRKCIKDLVSCVEAKLKEKNT
jgi:hypothetical protein